MEHTERYSSKRSVARRFQKCCLTAVFPDVHLQKERNLIVVKLFIVSRGSQLPNVSPTKWLWLDPIPALLSL